MASVSITWHALHDGHNICPICLDMDRTQYTWTFVVGVDKFPDTLTHPTHGVVWDKARGSTAHEHLKTSYGACKCGLSFGCEMKDFLARADALLEILRQLVSGMGEGGTIIEHE